MSLLKNFISENTITEEEVAFFVGKDTGDSPLTNEDVIDYIIESCEPLIKLVLIYSNQNEFPEERLYVGKYRSNYFLLSCFPDAGESDIAFFKNLTTKTVYNAVGGVFNFAEIMIENYEDYDDELKRLLHDDGRTWAEHHSINITWGFDFIEHLKKNRLDTARFVEAQKKINFINSEK